MKKLLGCFLCVMLLLVGSQAYALSVIPSAADYGGPQTSQSAINSIIFPIMGSSAVEQYKADVPSGESGPLAGYYQTVFNSSASDATISWTGSAGDPIVGPTAWLLVKDGNQSTAWYLFNLTDPPAPADWDGMEDLVLSGFWPDGGAISHVTLYGTQGVPEPATMLLLGSGLIVLAGFGRKKFKKYKI